VLLKAESIGTDDQEDLGVLMVCLVVGIFIAVVAMVVLELMELLTAMKVARRAATILKSLPREDPPDDSPAFYDVQIPVEQSNMGSVFVPKPPHALALIDPQHKLATVRLLTAENERLLDKFFDVLGHARSSVGGGGLSLVRSSRDVDGYQTVCVKYSRKTEASILAKAVRPSILAKNPSFSVEHIRDTFRFKVRYDVLGTTFRTNSLCLTVPPSYSCLGCGVLVSRCPQLRILHGPRQELVP
jgi:hypothetical protein